MRRFQQTATLLGLMACTGPVFAQAFNIDINNNLVPPASYGAFSGQTGFWNDYMPSAAGVNTLANMTDAAGGMTTVDITTTNPAFTPLGTNGNINPVEDRRLMRDYIPGVPDRLFQVNDLQAGEYLIYVYSWAPNSRATLECSTPAGGVVPGAAGGINSPPLYPGLVPGLSLDSCQIIVGPGDVLDIELTCLMGGGPGTGTGGNDGGDGGETGSDETYCVANGIQILPIVGTTFCSNQPPNSSGGNVTLRAWATDPVNGNEASIAANDLTIAAGVVNAPLVSPGTAVILWVSDSTSMPGASNCPLIGSRCIGTAQGGRLLRASIGTQTNFGTYAADIDFMSISNPQGQMGLSVMAGSSLYFQMIYRDFDSAMSCGGGAIARWTDAIDVLLAP